MELRILHYAHVTFRILQCVTHARKETIMFAAAADAPTANCETVGMADVVVVGFSRCSVICQG